ncbi:MAG: Gldg family protein [Butyricimonas paravirosa]
MRTKVLKYSMIVVSALLLGYLTSLPQMKLYYDGTYTKTNTLAPESQKVIQNLKGPLTITTYVNILAPDYFSGLPFNRNYDLARFERYMRFKPEIKMKYVYYYHNANNAELDARYPDLNDEERARALCDISHLNFKMFKSPEEIDKMIDLSGEGYQFVRIVEQENGRKEVLRLFNDNERHPREGEITATLKRFVAKAPMVAFSTGYGSRSINNYGGRGYYLFAEICGSDIRC